MESSAGGHQTDWEGGTCILCGDAEGMGIVQPREEKALVIEKMYPGSLHWCMAGEKRDN